MKLLLRIKMTRELFFHERLTEMFRAELKYSPHRNDLCHIAVTY